MYQSQMRLVARDAVTGDEKSHAEDAKGEREHVELFVPGFRVDEGGEKKTAHQKDRSGAKKFLAEQGFIRYRLSFTSVKGLFRRVFGRGKYRPEYGDEQGCGADIECVAN